MQTTEPLSTSPARPDTAIPGTGRVETATFALG